MYSKSIIETPVIFFFGAGATKPLGKLLMGEFIEHLEQGKGFKERPLFAEIVARERDLEFLFEELEGWIGKEYFAQSHNLALQKASEGLFGMAGVDPSYREFTQEFERVIQQAYALQSDLKKEVFHAYRQLSRPDAVVKLFTPLFDAVFDAQRPTRSPLVIFTTNYDPSVETFYEQLASKYNLCDGFFHDESATSYVWERSGFDQFHPSTNKRDIVLFKLHGSTNWTKTTGKIIKSPASIFVDSDATYENVLIYPAKRKVAINDPFFTGYDYFQRCAERSLLCIVIGYSFRDYDALTKLASAARYNQKLSVLVVDPDADKLCKRLKEGQISAEPVSAKFGFGPGLDEYLLHVKAAIVTALP